MHNAGCGALVHALVLHLIHEEIEGHTEPAA